MNPSTIVFHCATLEKVRATARSTRYKPYLCPHSSNTNNLTGWEIKEWQLTDRKPFFMKEECCTELPFYIHLLVVHLIPPKAIPFAKNSNIYILDQIHELHAVSYCDRLISLFSICNFGTIMFDLVYSTGP